MKPNRIKPYVTCLVACLKAFIVASHIGGAIAQAPNTDTKLPSGDPCAVVPLSDVQKAFPGAKPGMRSTRVEKYGLTECAWKDGGSQDLFIIQEFYGSDSAMEEAQGMAIGFLDSSKPGAARNLRYEILTSVGLGNEAVALIEASDVNRGIVSDGALLVLHRDQRTLFLTSPVLQDRDRAAALKTFEELGQIAAKWLD